MEQAVTLVSTPANILTCVGIMVAASLYLQKYKVFQYLGPAITCIIFGIILSNTKVLPFWHNTYGLFFQYGIPLTLTMFLLSVDIRQWVKLAKKPLLAMVFACISVCIMATIAGFLFAAKLPEGWKVAGMFVGTYTGGSSNLTAIGTGLGASTTTFAAANAADYAIGIPTIVLLFALPGIFMRSKRLQKLWKYSLPESELYDENEGSLYDAKEWSVNDVAMLVMLGLIVNTLSTLFSGLFDASIASAIRIVTMTTLALVFAQFKFIREIRGGKELGLFFSMFYLAAIGLSIDIKQFLEAAPLITLMCFIVSIGSLTMHLSLCRFFKIPYEYVIASISASISDGPTAALVCSSANWTGIIGTSIVLGAIGNAAGNYFGIGIAYLVKSVLGL